MNIDERLEALTMNLELLSHDIQQHTVEIKEHTKQIQDHTKQLELDGEFIRTLARIVPIHEQRLNDL
ncbi:MAG: hypothetical protein ACR2I2_02405 [Bryobacteraceae bacterium]